MREKGIDIIDSNRFSIFVHTSKDSDYYILENWVKWFNDRGIKAVLFNTSSGWAVYREGLILTETESYLNFLESKVGKFPANGLSRQNNAILYLLAQGYSHAAIAGFLGMNSPDIGHAKTAILKHLQVKSLLDVDRYAKELYCHLLAS